MRNGWRFLWLATFCAGCTAPDRATSSSSLPAALPTTPAPVATAPARADPKPVGCDDYKPNPDHLLACAGWDTGFGVVEIKPAGPEDAGLQATGPLDDYERQVLKWRGRSIAAFVGLDVVLVRHPDAFGANWLDVVVDAWVPGLNCRHEYRVVRVHADGRHDLSPVFGECAELVTAAVEPNGLRLVLEAYAPDNEPARGVEYLWNEGRLEFLREIAADVPKPTKADAPMLVITERGMGPVHLGMTIDSARRALPGARFERTSDGDGVALVEVAKGGEALMVLYAGEDDPGASIDGLATIQGIETFSPTVATQQGVAVGWLVDDARRIHGPVTKVWRSEIEQREYVEFERQPAWLQFRIDYTGEFAAGERQSTSYAANARIFSIAVSPPTPAE